MSEINNKTITTTLKSTTYNTYINDYDDKEFDEKFLEIASDSDDYDNQINTYENKNHNDVLHYDSDENNANHLNEEIDESVREELEDEYEENNKEIETRCAYCGITNASKLIKCNEKDCQRWFCDGRLDEYSASHLVFHLTKSKHKEIFLNESSPIGEMVLECYSCNCKNIFLLGFLESREGDTGIILCREPCLSQCKIVEDKFEKTRWVPLIKDKKLLDWIIPSQNETEIKLCSRVNIRSMSKLEDKWIKEKLKANEEKPKFLGNWLKAVKLCYNDGQDYLETFEPLISAEEEYDRKLKEEQKKHNIRVVYYKSNKRWVARFNYPREDNGKFLIYIFIKLN
jgi:regulator of nonsense transcripts 1